MKKLFVGLLVCVVALNSLSVSGQVLGVEGSIIDTVSKDGSLLINASDNVVIDQPQIEFAEDQVLVSIKHEYSGLNKLYSVDDFPGVNISEIEYLTPLTDDTNNKLIDYDEYKQILCLHLDIENEEDALNAINVLEKLPFVESASLNYKIIVEDLIEFEESVFEPIIDSNEKTNMNAMSSSTFPDDPYYSEQIGLELINCLPAWDKETGSSDVRVGIVDTGIASHPELNANLVVGYDFVNECETRYIDSHGHGTKVAGVIGAIGNNATGICGVSWDVSLVSLRVGEGRSFWVSDIIQAIKYAIDNDIDILNFSFGSLNDLSGDENAEYKNQIANFDGLVVCAAGNDAVDTDINPYRPAGFDVNNTIVVANAKDATTLSSSSNYGKEMVDLVAPGSSIRTVGLNGQYVTASGTSFAAPHVTGAAALLLSYNSYLSPLQMKKALMDSVTPVSTFTDKTKSGGMLNVDGALSLVMHERVRNYKVSSKFKNNEGSISKCVVCFRHNNESTDVFNYTINNTYDISKVSIFETEDGVCYFDTDLQNNETNEGTFVEWKLNCPFSDNNSVADFEVIGNTVYQSGGENFTADLHIVLMGDVNFDNVVNASDSSLINKSVVKLETFTDKQNIAADVNEDGEITADDALLVQQYGVKIVNSFW